MLLIDDRKTERLELHLLFEECVRSDGELNVAVAEAGKECPPLARTHRAGRARHDHRMVN